MYGTFSATDLEKIYKNLLEGYQLISPVASPQGSTEITVGFELYQVGSLVICCNGYL